jgi:DNA-binding transcriptional MerR regulator
VENRVVDLEWVELVRQALEAGISKNEIREFLQGQTKGIEKEYRMF